MNRSTGRSSSAACNSLRIMLICEMHSSGWLRWKMCTASGGGGSSHSRPFEYITIKRHSNRNDYLHDLYWRMLNLILITLPSLGFHVCIAALHNSFQRLHTDCIRWKRVVGCARPFVEKQSHEHEIVNREHLQVTDYPMRPPIAFWLLLTKTLNSIMRTHAIVAVAAQQLNGMTQFSIRWCTLLNR